jgi:hypothetical protein
LSLVVVVAALQPLKIWAVAVRVDSVLAQDYP